MGRKKGFRKKPTGLKKLKENKKVDNYIINHTRHGCYEVILKIGETLAYLTNKKDQVVIDPETCVPTPDFK
jgi:ribosomal protein L39E